MFLRPPAFLFRYVVIIVAVICGSGSQAYAAPQNKEVPHVVTDLVPEFGSVMEGQPLAFALTMDHVDGWHTYWKNYGDSGETTAIEWTLPEGVKATGLLYPAPERQRTGPLMNFGFDHKVTLLTSLEVSKDIKASTLPVTAKVTWLACMDICVPESKEFSFNLPVSAPPSPALHPEIFQAARAALPPPQPWQGMIEEQDQNLVITFRLDEASAGHLAKARDVFFFPEDWGLIKNAEPQISHVSGQQLKIVAQRDTRPLSEIATLNAVITYQDDNGTPRAASVSIPVSATPTSVTAQPTSSIASTAANPSLIQALFLAFIGGLILNLMPCVFPVLSMKALSLVKMSEREQKHATLHGVFYTLGVLLCFGGIAGSLIALQLAGQEIGWGFQLQNPVVVLLLAYLLFAMGLNMSGFFEMKGHIFANIGHRLAAKHGYAGTFFTGMLATIVATPCTAPFMATAMGYALTQPPVVALSVFLALGFGLAFPYLVLCFIPALRKALPKPGAWMTTFRQFLSFPLFASVAWLIWVYAQQVSGSYGTLLGLSGLLLIAFSIWIAHHEPRKQPVKTVIHALSVAALLLAFAIAALSHPKSAGEIANDTITKDIPYISYTKTSFDELLAGRDPLFVDMTASWCITCQVNERVALYTNATQALFKKYHVQYVVGDWTNQNPDITAYLAQYGRNGVPLYVYYGPRDSKTGQRPEPRVLPQLLTNGLVADVIQGIPE